MGIIKKINPLYTAAVSAGLAVCYPVSANDSKHERPNFIVIFADDQGYNDLGCFGSENIKTPCIDKMAREGLMLTTFYAQPVSGPSRGAILTGRYPTRIGGGWITNSSEITIAEMLKTRGYRTGCIGKWDISQRKFQAGIIPNDQGFDYYFGTLGANDRGIVKFYRNKEALEETNDMSILTSLYTEEAMNFITENKDTSFFLYLAHSMPHVKIDASKNFKGKSAGELFGDVVEEIDWNVGRILDLVKNLGIDKNTFVIYTSDNGPWSGLENNFRKTHQGQLATGSAKPLRSSKGSPYEGGFRVPCIFWAPGKIPAGIVKKDIMATLDILPTFAKLAGAKIPDDRVLDGFDQSDFIMKATSRSARSFFYYHVKGELHAVRLGKWKLLIPDRTRNFAYTQDAAVKTPELYDLENDISENINLADKYPKIVKRLFKMAKNAPEDLEAFTL